MSDSKQLEADCGVVINASFKIRFSPQDLSEKERKDIQINNCLCWEHGHNALAEKLYEMSFGVPNSAIEVCYDFDEMVVGGIKEVCLQINGKEIK